MNNKKSEKKEHSHMQPNKDNDNRNRVEALLFASGKKLSAELISGISGIKDLRETKKSLLEIKQIYDDKDSALMIVEDVDGWKITVREKYLPIVRKIVADTELSKTVMETLAVIAWKTPVLQSEVIRIRTNKAYDHIQELIDTGFVTKEKHGRSFILKITQKFYDYFDVEGKEDIRKVFSKVKDENIQKKVDEFEGKKDAPKTIGNLKVVDTKPFETVKDAVDRLETEKVGKLEVYSAENQDNKSYAPNLGKKDIKEEKPKEDDEETLRKKTKKIVKELLEEDREKKENKKQM